MASPLVVKSKQQCRCPYWCQRISSVKIHRNPKMATIFRFSWAFYPGFLADHEQLGSNANVADGCILGGTRAVREEPEKQKLRSAFFASRMRDRGRRNLARSRAQKMDSQKKEQAY
jgi:hypothetical protein